MFIPKKMKYRKHQRGSINQVTGRGFTLSFGDYGLKAISSGFVSAREIESGRRAITRLFKRGGQIWIRIFPDKPITKKPNETRMGKGKGDVDHFSAVVEKGRIIYEVAGIDEATALEGLRLAQAKMSVRTKIIKKNEA